MTLVMVVGLLPGSAVLATEAAETTAGDTGERVPTGGEYSVFMEDHQGDWKHETQVELWSTGQNAASRGEYVELEHYALEDIVYVSNPTNPELQYFNLYAPAEYMTTDEDGNIVVDPDGVFHVTDEAGNPVLDEAGNPITYTAETAPIIFYNVVGGYSEALPTYLGQSRPAGTTGQYYNFVEQGFIYVGVGSRGKETTVTDENGTTYTGKAPIGLVDLKACVRFLTFNDELLPGDAGKIVSIGTSAGGAMSTLLGATGNAPEYEPYLDEAGAADANDDIFAAVCYCPVGNLDTADAGYEWQHAANEYNRNGNPFSELQSLLSDELYDIYVTYIQDYGLDLTDNGRDGAYFEEFVALYEDAIGVHAARIETGEEITTNYGTVDAFIAAIDPDGDWLDWNAAEGTAKILDWDAFAGSYWTRLKDLPSFDSFNYGANEGPAFGTEDGDTLHFSRVVVEALNEVSQDTSVSSAVRQEASDYYDIYAAEVPEVWDNVLLMSAMTYVDDENATKAPNWRFRIGSDDSDYGSVVGHTLKQALEMHVDDVNVDIAITWGMGHSAAEYEQLNDLVDYVHEISFSQTYSMDLADYADQWEYHEKLEMLANQTQEPTGVFYDLEYYSLENVVYVSNPVDTEFQKLNIFVPVEYMQMDAQGNITIDWSGEHQAVDLNGNIVYDSQGEPLTYTAATAFIVYYNTVNGYAAGEATSIGLNRMDNTMYDFVEHGFIYVGVAARGKDTEDEDGNITGKLPVSIVDLKAGIRFLKANADLIPGDTGKIFSYGTSAGGAMSALLGTTGNSVNYEPYLTQLGAANAPDDIYGAICYCPITNLNSADAAFEWMHIANTQWRDFSGNNGDVLDELQLALSQELYDTYVVYVQDMGLDLDDDGRGGDFFEGFVAMYEEALETYVARYYPDEVDAAAYIDSLLAGEGDWLTWDDDSQTATIDWDDYAVNRWPSRRKTSPGFDWFDRNSSENLAFGTETDGGVHFSTDVRNALGSLVDNYDAGKDAYDPAEAQAYYDEYDEEITELTQEQAYLLTPLNYVGTDEESDKAPYWRIHTGSVDPNLGAVAGYTLAKALELYEDDVTVESRIIWGLDHSAAEYEFLDVMEYIHETATGRSLSDPDDTDKDPDDTDKDPEEPEDLSELPYIVGYGNGTFLPSANITRAETVAILYNLYAETPEDLSALNRFTDVTTGHWAADAIAWSIESGFISGYGDGTMRPGNHITRAELASILAALDQTYDFTANLTLLDDAPVFTDIGGHWAIESIEYLTSYGIISGYGDGTFLPNQTITRAETVSMVSKALNRSEDFTPGITFSDVDTGHWAYHAIMNAANGLII